MFPVASKKQADKVQEQIRCRIPCRQDLAQEACVMLAQCSYHSTMYKKPADGCM